MPRWSLYHLFAISRAGGDRVSDRELLSRFVATRDSAAFELLVRRHADAVWAAGFRVLGNASDAEDAFQATFLALLRKAGSVRDGCVGGWLHRVAVNAALKLKASGRREPTVRAGEQPADTGRSPEDTFERAELTAIVHQELALLPDRYRLPVVLCDLEGHTHAEAAKTLGWPIGSVSGRLSRAHAILRDRLTRRGLAAPVVLFAAIIAPTNAVAAALAVASGTAAVSPIVSSLTAGVLFTMRIAKLKLIAAVFAATGFVAVAGTGTVYSFTRPGPPVMVAGVEAALPLKVAAPVPDEPPPIEGDWTPKDWPDGKKGPIPTAFPDLKLPDPELAQKNFNEYTAAVNKLLPLILGKDSLTIEATDDTYRRLLKARLNQGCLEIQKVKVIIEIGRWDSTYLITYLECLTDMRNVSLELWGNDPKVLLPWLEEFVLMGKVAERFMNTRVITGTDPPQNLNTVVRHRLAAEAALWKAKKPAAGKK